MVLSPGAKLGPYVIEAPLGAGGMGEVYRARDTRLDRIVAVKVLPARTAADAGVRDRFEREARALSSLDHAHICAVYDVGREPLRSAREAGLVAADSAVDFLVLQYLEGETLADRIARGPLPLDLTLTLGGQIASALDAAHRCGIVHRDLKPSNVMLTKSGTGRALSQAKLLDFGLAKQTAPPVVEGAESRLVTKNDVTLQGTIVGTLQYMAPEQLDGREAGPPTDIFAFGLVLYEMAAGCRAFDAAAPATLIGAILKEEPRPVSTMRSDVPHALDWVIARCLAKDPSERWQSAHDVQLALAWIGTTRPDSAPRPAASRRRRVALPAVLGCTVGALAAAVLAWLWLGGEPPRGPDLSQIRFVLPPPEGTTISVGPAAPQMALTSDGRRIVFSATTADNDSHLYIQSLDSLTAQPLAGTKGGELPFWSPDDRAIGFFASGEKLSIVDANGGSARAVTDAYHGAASSPNGTVIFSARDGTIQRVSASGGPPAPVTRLDVERQERRHVWPSFLPDGQRFLYFAISGRADGGALHVGSLDGSAPTRLMTSDSRGLYAEPGFVLWVKGGTLFAQRFDPDRLALHGEPMAIVDRVAFNPSEGRAAFAVSQNGVLAYRPGDINAGDLRQLTWVDRAGSTLGRVGDSGYARSMALSPDGKRLAVDRAEPTSGKRDVWIVDLTRAALATRFTFAASESRDAAWSPDGQRVAWVATTEAGWAIVMKAAGGAGAEEILWTSSVPLGALDWTRDGRFLVFDVANRETQSDVFILPLSGERKAVPFLQNPFDEARARISPDGRWIAYDSNESGRGEVYVQSFPTPGQKWRISTDGGLVPRWRADSRELFYRTAEPDGIMAVSIPTESGFEPDVPRRLFLAPVRGYAVAADGQRFLLNVSLDMDAERRVRDMPPIHILVNWPAGLTK